MKKDGLKTTEMENEWKWWKKAQVNSILSESGSLCWKLSQAEILKNDNEKWEHFKGK